MPPLTQQQLNETLIALFGWVDFSCPAMPKTNSYYCHVTVPGLTFNKPSLTKQSFKEEADINNIVNRYHQTGVMPSGSRQPLYGDFSSGDDFNSSLIKLQEAQEDFDSLPSSVRTRFDNDPAQLLNFLSDPDNRAEAVELGLLQADSSAVGGQGAQPHTPEERDTTTPPLETSTKAPPPTS